MKETILNEKEMGFLRNLYALVGKPKFIDPSGVMTEEELELFREKMEFPSPDEELRERLKEIPYDNIATTWEWEFIKHKTKARRPFLDGERDLAERIIERYG